MFSHADGLTDDKNRDGVSGLVLITLKPDRGYLSLMATAGFDDVNVADGTVAYLGQRVRPRDERA